MATRLYYGSKTYDLRIDFNYSSRVVRAQIENLTGVPSGKQRIVLDSKTVWRETVEPGPGDLRRFFEGGESGTPRSAVLLRVPDDEGEQDPAKLPVLNALRQLAFRQDEQSLAFSTTAQSFNMQNMQSMMSRIQGNAKQVMIYEDADVQAEALAVIPVVQLHERAMTSEDPRSSFSDELLKQLLRWFKHEFFSWTNQPKCHACSGSTTYAGGSQPTAEEQRGHAGRVEVYTCTACNATTRFPRYNHPGKLLQTRTGRCGEWANCFTLCCRSMGLEARLASDWTDHVWTEVYSESLGRWLHCDSCENAMDAPLMYESGWGKKLTYVISCARDEVVDVTWRYTKKKEEVLGRRNLVSEGWLQSAVTALDRKQRIGRKVVNATRAAAIESRRKVEMKQLADGPDALDRNKEAENCGRISGSVVWRRSRNELGSGAAQENALRGRPGTSGDGEGAGTGRGTPPAVTAAKRVHRVAVRAGALIDQITFYAVGGKVLCQEGGNGGSACDDLVLHSGEHIVKIIQKYGNSLDSVTFITSTGRSKRYGGDGGSETKEFSSKEGEMIVGLSRKQDGFCPIIEKVEYQQEEPLGVEESKNTE